MLLELTLHDNVMVHRVCMRRHLIMSIAMINITTYYQGLSR